MHREGVDTAGIVRVQGATAPVSGIMIDASGERMIATYRDKRIEVARAPNPDALVKDATLLLADNRFPDYVRPICEAARRRRDVQRGTDQRAGPLGIRAIVLGRGPRAGHGRDGQHDVGRVDGLAQRFVIRQRTAEQLDAERFESAGVARAANQGADVRASAAQRFGGMRTDEAGRAGQQDRFFRHRRI